MANTEYKPVPGDVVQKGSTLFVVRQSNDVTGVARVRALDDKMAAQKGPDTFISHYEIKPVRPWVDQYARHTDEAHPRTSSWSRYDSHTEKSGQFVLFLKDYDEKKDEAPVAAPPTPLAPSIITDLQAKLEHERKISTELGKQADEYRHRLQIAQNDLGCARNDRDYWQQKANHWNNEAAVLQNKLNDSPPSDKEREDLQLKIGQLNMKMDKLQEEASTSSRLVHEAVYTKAEQDNVITKLSQEISRIQDNCDKLAKENRRFDRALQHSATVGAQIISQREAMSKTISKVSEEKTRLGNEIQKLTGELSKVLGDMNDLNLENELLEAKLSQREEELALFVSGQDHKAGQNEAGANVVKTLYNGLEIEVDDLKGRDPKRPWMTRSALLLEKKKLADRKAEKKRRRRKAAKVGGVMTVLPTAAGLGYQFWPEIVNFVPGALTWISNLI